MSDASATPDDADVVDADTSPSTPSDVPPVASGVSSSETAAVAGEGESLEDLKARKQRRLKLICAVGGGLFCVLGVAAGAGAAIVGTRPAHVELAVNTPSSYYPMPEVIASLAPEGKRPHRIRVGITLEVEEANLGQVKAQEAAIIGATQDHLLDLRPADLAGRIGAENLRRFIREEVQGRTTPGVVRNVLFTIFIVD